MQLWLIILLSVIGGIVAVYLIAGLIFALYADRAVFGRRQDKNADYRYFTAEELKLNGEKFPVKFGDVALEGNLWYDGNLEEIAQLVIFVHGFGAGSSSYMTEIASLVRSGFAVLSYDAYGCNNSVGKNIKGFYNGALCAVAAYDAAMSDSRLRGKKKFFVAHSWGAYSALCALKFAKVDGVVALSAFNSPVRALVDAVGLVAGSHARELASMAMPWFYLINFFRFGIGGNTCAAKVAAESGVNCLLIHGARDKTVPLANSAAKNAEGQNITALILRDRGHNPYNTAEAERTLSTLFSAASKSDAERTAFLRAFDWVAATREDEEVMREIYKFICTGTEDRANDGN